LDREWQSLEEPVALIFGETFLTPKIIKIVLYPPATDGKMVWYKIEIAHVKKGK